MLYVGQVARRLRRWDATGKVHGDDPPSCGSIREDEGPAASAIRCAGKDSAMLYVGQVARRLRRCPASSRAAAIQWTQHHGVLRRNCRSDALAYHVFSPSPKRPNVPPGMGGRRRAIRAY